MKRLSPLSILAVLTLSWLGICAPSYGADKSSPADGAAAKKPSTVQVSPRSGGSATIVSIRRDVKAGVPAPLPADPARVAAARGMVQALGLREKALASLERFVPVVTKSTKFRNPKLTDADLKKVPDRIRANAHATLGRLLEYAAHVYARHYTVDEMKAITAFYRSPAGRRMLSEDLKVEQELAPIKGSWTYGYIVATNKQTGGKPLEPGMVVNVRRNPPASPAPKPH